IEDWRQMLLPLFLPPFLPILIAGSAATMLAMRMAFAARRDIKLSRDHIADGEAVRMTHFPEALVGALEKIGGHGRFEGSRRIEALLFDGPSDHDGGTHPPIADRIAAITALGRDLLTPGRLRKDTRGALKARPRFGVRPKSVMAHEYPFDEEGRPLSQPPTPTLALNLMRFTDPPAYRRWNEACFAWFEWRASDQRNALGLTPKMLIPVVAVSAFLLVFHWPADSDPAKFVNTFSPVKMAQVFEMVKMTGPTCEGPSYPDGKCDGTFSYTSKPARSQRPNPWSSSAPADSHIAEVASADRDSGPPDVLVFSLIVMGLFIAVLAPKQLKWLFGVVEEMAEKTGRTMAAQQEAKPRERRTMPSPKPEAHTVPPPDPALRSVPPRPPSSGFGRKRV
ncbi:MAG: hypothetical protein ACKVOL_05990, partial [Novosphingobium sp.]